MEKLYHMIMERLEEHLAEVEMKIKRKEKGKKYSPKKKNKRVIITNI